VLTLNERSKPGNGFVTAALSQLWPVRDNLPGVIPHN